MTADSLSEESVRTGTWEKLSELRWSKGGSVCIKKHTGRRDIGAPQKEGDRPALRAAAPTQRGLSSLQPSARTSQREGVPLKITLTLAVAPSSLNTLLKNVPVLPEASSWNKPVDRVLLGVSCAWWF